MYNYALTHLNNMISINRAKKKLFFNIVYTKKILQYTYLLRKFNYIRYYKLTKKNNKILIKIYLQYHNLIPIGLFFKTITKPSKAYYVTLKALKLINKRSGQSVFIMSTSKGLMSHQAAIKKNIGGAVMGFFSI